MTFADTVKSNESAGLCFLGTYEGNAVCAGVYAGEEDGSFRDGGAFAMWRHDLLPLKGQANFYDTFFGGTMHKYQVYSRPEGRKGKSSVEGYGMAKVPLPYEASGPIVKKI